MILTEFDRTDSFHYQGYDPENTSMFSYFSLCFISEHDFAETDSRLLYFNEKEKDIFFSWLIILIALVFKKKIINILDDNHIANQFVLQVLKCQINRIDNRP